ncbi:MAG: MBL fold metallo-hydrolase [Porticoccaceae bacterium]
MSDYFEIDFLDVESSKSGDAISIRYKVAGDTRIHVVDGGFQDTGDSVISHINTYYENPKKIDSVVVTHPDGDHAGGLRKVLEEFNVDELWMLRPWQYAHELIDRFSRYKSVENLEERLREVYPNIDALEKIAINKGIPIYEPFQGALIGEFTVMAPTKNRYLDLVVESEKTPEASKEESALDTLDSMFEAASQKVISLWRSFWGEENFSEEETSSENEMSVIQFANICGKRILLTGDAGRSALIEAADYAPVVGLELPGIDRFQVPHHGSRRNVSTEILDSWLGPRLDARPVKGEETFTAIISAAKKDEHHPRKAVVRGLMHRGAKAVTTEGTNVRTSYNAPEREGWSAAKPLEYPEEQEE